MTLSIVRLWPSDTRLAKDLFALMGEVFEEERPELSDAYVEALLARPDFWALAAMSGTDPVGGLTGHVLPLTRAPAPEFFVYDIAVRADHQRRGVGRHLMDHMRREAAAMGCRCVFVAADDEDTHALDFYRALGGSASAVTMFTFETKGPDRASSEVVTARHSPGK
jgi:aminoglycoside 3-N-acetyltransferase I